MGLKFSNPARAVRPSIWLAILSLIFCTYFGQTTSHLNFASKQISATTDHAVDLEQIEAIALAESASEESAESLIFKSHELDRGALWRSSYFHNDQTEAIPNHARKPLLTLPRPPPA